MKLGSSPTEQNHCTSAAARLQAGIRRQRGTRIKRQCHKAIAISSCHGLTNYLGIGGPRTDRHYIEAAEAREYQHVIIDLTNQFHEIPETDKLYSPQPDDGYVDIFEDGEWLIGALALNHAIFRCHIRHRWGYCWHPKCFYWLSKFVTGRVVREQDWQINLEHCLSVTS